MLIYFRKKEIKIQFPLNFKGLSLIILSFLFLIFNPQRVKSQNASKLIQVTGTVVDENSQVIPGVTVVEKKSNKGTNTAQDGKFSITVPSGSTLVFSLVGYATQEINVKNFNTLNVKMFPAVNILNETVVIGYQTTRKSDFTGAIASVKASELNLSTPTIGQALVGKVAGVSVNQVTGSPYAGVKIRVRGIGSVNASSDPLYVIDGYPAGNDVFLNPEDIQSIDILKDAASAAIYGSRASGGVVIITTKRGKEGKGTFEYDGQFGIDQLAHKVALMNADQFAQLVIDGRNNAYHDFWTNAGHTWSDAMYSDSNSVRIANVGNAGSVSIPNTIYNFSSQTPIHQTINTDWQNELYRSHALFQSHTINFSGSNDGNRYFLSAGYQDQQGIMLGTGQQKVNLRANYDGNIGKRLKVSANWAYTHNVNQESQDGRWDHSPALGALIYLPYFPAYNSDGSIATNLVAAQSPAYAYQSIENPLATATYIKINRTGNRSTYNGQISYSILPALTAKANLGYQTYSENYNYYNPTSISNGANPPYSSASIAAAKDIQQLVNFQDQLGEFTLNYNKNFGNHHLDLLALYSAQRTTNNVLTVQGTGYQNDNVQNIAGAAPTNITILTSGPTGTQGTQNQTYTLVSNLARAQYNYKGKYFLQGSVRRDGSSRFGANNRYGTFPSASLGWTVSNESFYHNWLGNESTLKFRGSWGLSGNNNIGNYSAIQTINPPGSVVFNSPGASSSGTVASATTAGNIADGNLGWESTSQFNFGADLGLLKGRLFVLVNYYLSSSYNLLFNIPISAESGSTSILTNLKNSNVSNKGFDIQLDGKPIVTRKFTLDISGNFSLNRNKVVNLGGANTIITNGAERSYLTSITETGQPIGMFFGYRKIGQATAQDIANYNVDQANFNTATGQYNTGYKPIGPARSNAVSGQSNPLHEGDFYFQNITGTGVLSTEDRQIIGSPYPKFTYGFSINLNYENLYLTSAFNGSYGNQVLDGQDYYLYNGEGSGNQYETEVNRWRSHTMPGDGSFYRASRAGTQSNSTRLSTVYLQDGSFLRCDNITLGYTLKTPSLSKVMGINSFKFFGTANNIFTITKYKGYNPEVDYDYSFSGSQGTNLTPGIDYGVYPLVRSYNFGVKLIF